MDNDEPRDVPTIVLVGVGGGGSRILSEGLEKVERNLKLDRYACLARAIDLQGDLTHAFIIDTAADPENEGFYTNIPKPYKISLSGSIKGMSRGAGGRPGRATKAVLDKEVARTLATRLYKPIVDIGPAIVVLIHTADGGTGGGLTPELLQQLAYVLPNSTVFWVFTVLPQRSKLAMQGPRTVAPNLGKLMAMVRRIAERDYNNIPFACREAIREIVPPSLEEQSDEFRFSRVAVFPMSNDHFSRCWKGGGRREIREEVLNPFPIEVLSQALYPFLKYVIATPEERGWMQRNWPMGPIDIPDIMAGVSPERPFVLPHLLVDPDLNDEDFIAKVIEDFRNGEISLTRTEGDKEEGLPDMFTFTGAPCSLYEFRATALYCIPVYPDGSRYFEDFGDLIGDIWFPALSGSLNYIGGKRGDHTGIVSHSANLKPQPIPGALPGSTLGFDDGLLVTLVFGAVPKDFPIWLKATAQILDEHRTEELWELSHYDASTWLTILGNYIGWKDWRKDAEKDTSI